MDQPKIVGNMYYSDNWTCSCFCLLLFSHYRFNCSF